MSPPPQARSTRMAPGDAAGGMCPAREAASQCSIAKPPEASHHWSASSSYCALSLRRGSSMRTPGPLLLQRVVTPVHQRVPPSGVLDVLLGRLLGQVPLDVPVDLPHVGVVLVGEVAPLLVQQLDDLAAGLVSRSEE